jgi:hypothetical protein
MMQPNRRLLPDALPAQLRRAHRAAKPGRYAATKPSPQPRTSALDMLIE